MTRSSRPLVGAESCGNTYTAPHSASFTQTSSFLLLFSHHCGSPLALAGDRDCFGVGEVCGAHCTKIARSVDVCPGLIQQENLGHDGELVPKVISLLLKQGCNTSRGLCRLRGCWRTEHSVFHKCAHLAPLCVVAVKMPLAVQNILTVLSGFVQLDGGWWLEGPDDLGGGEAVASPRCSG